MKSFDVAIDVGNGKLGKKLTVKIINKIDQIDVGVLNLQENSLILKLSKDLHHDLAPDVYSINYGDSVGSYVYKDGILYHIVGEYFGITDVNKKSKVGMVLRFNQDWKDIPKDLSSFETPNFSDLKQKFSMKPPAVDVPPSLASPEQILEPLPYIQSRYYNILYSTSIPLNYFPKTALSRLKVLCNNDVKILKDTLTHMFLTTEEFNIRHEGKFGLLKLLGETSGGLKQDELVNQTEFISKHSLKQKNELANGLVLELKSREAQMQLLILLELLISMGIFESEFLSAKQSPQKSKSKRPVLVRKKNSKRKIIPTFLGMGVSLTNTPTKSNQDLTMFGMLTTLTSLLEKMNLWDTLSTERKDKTMTFVAYVLVPYYKAKLPETMNFIIDRIKGSNLKFRKPSFKRERSERSDKKRTERTEKLPKETSFERPKLNTLDGKTFAPFAPPKRSNSNLSSKNLHRRQVDFSSKATKSKSMTDLSGDKVSVFELTKRTKSLKPMNSQMSQVTATPIKKSISMIEVNQTPISKDIKQLLLPPIDSSPIQSTPMKALMSPVALKTLPINSSPLPSSERKKRPGEPVAFQDSPFFSSLNGSPINESVFKRAGSKRRK